MEIAVAHLQSRLLDTSIAGVAITYVRGSDSVSLTATVDSELLRVTEASGATRTLRTEASFAIDPTTLVINSAVVEPKRGDRIQRVIGGVTKYFDVLSPGPGEPAFIYTADGSRQLMMIRTKEGHA